MSTNNYPWGTTICPQNPPLIISTTYRYYGIYTVEVRINKTYDYDEVSNMISKETIIAGSATNTTYEYNANDQLITVVDPVEGPTSS